MSNLDSSDPLPTDPLTPPGRLAVLEGLPGGGKSTVARALWAECPVIGEYTDTAGATTPMQAHPSIDDDHAHQANWVTKAKLAEAHLATNPLVICDRDWLSSLAYAYCTAPLDGGRLLRQRCAWGLWHLRRATLRAGDIYLILDIDASTSLFRRAGRLRTGHPWSTPGGLARLEEFYRDPAAVLAPASTALARHLAAVRIEHIPADQPPAAAHTAITDLVKTAR